MSADGQDKTATSERGFLHTFCNEALCLCGGLVRRDLLVELLQFPAKKDHCGLLLLLSGELREEA